MIQRQLQQTIIQSLQNFPVVALLGSRQVGKTTLAKSIAQNHSTLTLYIDLELPSDRAKLTDPELFLQSHHDKLVIIDEIQRMPELFPLLRALVDRTRRSGQFLILGSASPTLRKHSSESLAGRIQTHELTPFVFSEVQPNHIAVETLWSRGGYPNSVLAKDDALSYAWRQAFIQTHLERDIPQLGIHVSAQRLGRFLTMIAHSNGQLFNASHLAVSLGVSAPTVQHYLDIFTDTFILRQLQPYHTNMKKRLVKRAKVFVRDSGLLHALLNLHDISALQSHPVVGFSWEGFVLEHIYAGLPPDARIMFYRTANGTEVDLVISINAKNIFVVEVKYSLSPTLAEGFWSALDFIRPQHAYVVYPGKERFPLKDNVTAVPFTQLDALLDKTK